MSKLTPRERADLVKRVKEINAKIQNPRLTIAQCDELHKERDLLSKQLRDDRSSP
jgi:hypothetical protein